MAAETRYRAAHISDIPTYPSDLVEGEWKPVRYFFGISAFGANVYVGRSPGELVIEEHADDDHEELYVVLSGTARFTVDGDAFDAPAGTFVFVPTDVVRAAHAGEDGAAVLALGAPPGSFEVSEWEKKRVTA